MALTSSASLWTGVVKTFLCVTRSFMDSDIESLLAAKICWAWDDGCPVAAHDTSVAVEMAAVARRRWGRETWAGNLGTGHLDLEDSAR